MNLYDKLCLPEKSKEIRGSKVFNETRLMRNKIEHIYEGLSKHGEYFSQQYGSMGENNEIEIDGISFEASETSLQPLYQIYEDISKIITERYINPNRELVDRILGDAL